MPHIKYTVLSFNFNDYDKIRQPKVIDPEAHYTFITDLNIPGPSKWKFKVDQKLANRNPVYASYYVRYHPFEFADTDIVVVVDASIQINDSLSPLVDEFIKSGADYSPMLTNYRDDGKKMEYFHDALHRVSRQDIKEMNGYISSKGQEGWKGSIGCAFAMFRNTQVTRELLSTVWDNLVALGYCGIPNRMDEVVLHKELHQFFNRIKLFITSIQIIQSTYMTYCTHRSSTPVPKYKNYDQMYYICNTPVSPARFSKEFNYPREYRCRTEAMLLTKYMDRDDLKEWLDWHIFRCGFDRVHVFDNECGHDLKSVCSEYGDTVTYELVEGIPRQYRLYDEYVNWKSGAEWVMPIDDDEYLDLGRFGSIGEALDHFSGKFPHLGMLAIRWKHLFPKDFSAERTGKVLEYCTEENPELGEKFMRLGDRTVKCIVRHVGPVHYEETWENPAGGHVPVNACFLGALTCWGKTVTGCGISTDDMPEQPEEIRLLHCRYKGPADWENKRSETTVSDSLPHRKKFTSEWIPGTL